MERALHILILSDRDWTHPQGGGTGTNLYGQVSRWIAWGHRVTVVACSYPGAAAIEHHGEQLTLIRVGGRSTVFPLVIWRGLRGRLPDADVVLEVINGITFLTPLWLRRPRLTLIHHVHRDHYIEEMGSKGRLAALLLEGAPLRLLYRGSRFLTISKASAEEIAEHGIARDRIAVGYIGVEAQAFEPDESARSAQPRLLYLGRLKRYKRVELVLDALESAAPATTLDIAGEGDHHAVLAAEIERRDLGARVRMHGHVSEQRKRELLREAWVNLTASSAEGWCLTVMEAAASGTPSAALAVGGLPESIADGHSGLLADDIDGLREHAARLTADRALVQRLGGQARTRALEFTWDRTARETLDELRAVVQSEPEPSLRRRLGSSDTGRAAGLAAALMANNFIALVFTVAFARLLGASGYGSLGALIAVFTVLMVPGSALQATVAREVSGAGPHGAGQQAAGVWRWLERLALGIVAAAVVGVILREPIADAVGVGDQWGAAAILPSGALWLVLCVLRGTLQGLGRYRAVGLSIVAEAGARLGLGLVLYGAGLGVTGAFLGTTVAIAVVSLALLRPLLQAVPREDGADVKRFRALLAGAWAPVLAFSLIAALQNIDIVYVKHMADSDAAGSYAAASVAAKAVIWVAIGLGLYLLPEAVRRTRAGRDARPVLWRTLALIGVVALPMVLVYAVAGRALLGAVFGPDLTAASGALPLLGVAMGLLACAYLGVQYLLALGRSSFVFLLALAAVVELVVLVVVGAALTTVALTIACLQLVLAPALLVLVVRGAGRAVSSDGYAT